MTLKTWWDGVVEDMKSISFSRKDAEHKLEINGEEKMMVLPRSIWKITLKTRGVADESPSDVLGRFVPRDKMPSKGEHKPPFQHILRVGRCMWICGASIIHDEIEAKKIQSKKQRKATITQLNAVKQIYNRHCHTNGISQEISYDQARRAREPFFNRGSRSKITCSTLSEVSFLTPNLKF